MRRGSNKYSLLQQRDGYGWCRVCFKGTGIGAWFIAGRVRAGEPVASVIDDYGKSFTRAAVKQALLLTSEMQRKRQTDITVYWRSNPRVPHDRPRSIYAN